jgi:Zn-dependent protease
VPVNPARFRSPRTGQLAVSVAGIATNFGIALLCASLLGAVGTLLHRVYPAMSSQGFMNPWREVTLSGLPHAAAWSLLAGSLKQGVTLNMVLFSLNVLPVPPLDGFGLLEAILPTRVRGHLTMIRPWGFFIFIALMTAGVFRYLVLPGALFALLLNYFAGAQAKLG